MRTDTCQQAEAAGDEVKPLSRGNVSVVVELLFFVLMFFPLPWILEEVTPLTVFIAVGCTSAFAVYWYFRSHMRPVSVQGVQLLIGGLVWPSKKVIVPLDKVSRIELNRPLNGLVRFTFKEKTPAGIWVIIVPLTRAKPPSEYFPDIRNLMDRIRKEGRSGRG